MTTMTRCRPFAAICGTLAAASAAALFATSVSGASPKFFADDPIRVEHETQDASSMKPLDVDLVVDLTYNLLTGKAGPSVRARNVNTVDEVPDSSWFTNRIGARPVTAAEIAIGPDMTDGPAAGPWIVTASKSDGVTPGFTIRDARGTLWFLKFDPPGYRAMTTGTEVMVTKLMWALGYNVPENHIAYLRRDRLVVGDGAKFTPAGGKRRPMRTDDLDTLLRRAEREPDGSYRVVASKALEGKPIGRIRFFDTRPDDPNDIVPHEHRRELRGYGVFAAWLNHVDAKAINSLDTLVTENNNRSYVRHHLLDFGSTLGSGGVAPADPFAGGEYLLEPRQMIKQMAGFGFYFPKWHTQKFFETKAVGRLAADNTAFDPETWKPRVPNRAFLQARADDKFWAAQRLAAMSAELIRAAVRAGDFGDPASEEFLVNALAERRDAIVRRYLPALNPIADPRLDEDGVLRFRNAAVDADVAHAPCGYHARWSTFDNATGHTALIGESVGGATAIKAPRRLPNVPNAFIKVELRSSGAVHAAWEKPVAAYFRLVDASARRWILVGFERVPEA
jgi:hypothetical protein